MTLLDDDELLSSSERAPTAALPAPAGDHGMRKECPECGITESKKTKIPFYTQAQVEGHRRSAHGSHPAGRPRGSTTKKAPAKKVAATKAPATNKPVVPIKAKPSRTSSAPWLAKQIGRLGKLMEGVSPPTARAMVFSAHAAAPAIDELIAGGRIDKVVQKVATTSQQWETIGDAIGLPMMVLLCDTNPKLFAYFEDDLRDAVKNTMVKALPHLKAERMKEKKVAEAIAELGELDPEIAASDDPVGSILAGFFASPGDDEQGG